MRIEPLGRDVRVHPTGPVRGVVELPGSKSLTNRHLLCAALADGVSTLRGASASDDARRMANGLRALGIEVRGAGGAGRAQSHPAGRPRCAEPAHSREADFPAEPIVIDGCGGHIPADAADVDAGGAGTAMRFLAALSALGRGRYRLDGSARMRERPMAPLADALVGLGAVVEHEIRPGFPPLTIVASGLRGGVVEFRSPPSSQFVSALLMIAPYASGDVMIRIEGGVASEPYLRMTEAVMRVHGVEVIAAEVDAGGPRLGGSLGIVVPAHQRYRPADVRIEPDASAACYLWAAAAITGGRVRVAGLSRESVQGDVRFVDVLERMGCSVSSQAAAPSAPGGWTEVAGPPPGGLRGVSVDLNGMPDAVQTLAVVALFADGPTRIRNVANLRIKETDRIAALARELTRLGASVEEHDDGLGIVPPTRITPAAIETYDDHRMAMSFALAGLGVEGITIRDAACVSKSFPDYFNVLQRV